MANKSAMALRPPGRGSFGRTGLATRTSFSGATVILIGGALILSIAMGVRQSYGLFTTPLAVAGLPVETFAFAIALQNLIWGVVQPFAGATADRWGAGWVVVGGGLFYAAGLTLTAFGGNALATIAGAGILVGIGISAVSFSVVMGAIGRSVPDEKRSAALGIATAGGSFGQVVVPLAAQWLIQNQGATWTFYVLAAVALGIIPLAVALVGAPTAKTMAQNGDPALTGDAAVLEAAQPLSEALAEAGRHNGYILLTLGFFVCGFQLSFIAVHLPNFLASCHLSGRVGGEALAVIGLFNMFGSWACGYLGGRFRAKYILSLIYIVRVVAITAFLLLPKNETNTLIFSAVMGVVWLGTVPLVSVLVSGIFGTKHLGTLFGVVFLNHQIGSFLGAWLGGYLYTQTGSYNLVWTITIVAGVAAAFIHLPIADRSIRVAMA